MNASRYCPKNMTFFLCFLAEILPENRFFSEYDQMASGTLLAGLLCLILVCLGVAVSTGVLLYWLKKPVRSSELAERLISRALPVPMMSIISVLLVLFYLLTSWGYQRFYPGDELMPQALIIQVLGFHLPMVIAIGLLFHAAGLQAREVFGCRWKNAPAHFGLSIVYYLACIPPVWFLSAISQYLLQLTGYVSHPQEVIEMMTAPGPWVLRACLFVIAIVAAPVFEEIVFRGIFLPFMVQRIGFWPGLLSVSLVFAGMHFHIPSLAPLFLLF
ncbi:MAG: CPBP family intramembrane metalloprotease, partial [Kiritimatiellaceae bacterium]|nr:CPBP family intramembrane metalloprotease [Kiritimatiellaceae bacterium]